MPEQKGAAGKDAENEPNELAVSLNKWVEETYDTEENKAWRTRLKENRKYAVGRDLGKTGTSSDEGLVRANLIYSTIQTILPRVYAKNPEIAISPAETVDEKREEWIKPFCQTLSIVLRRQFTDAKLKKRGKSSTRSAMTVGLAWLKVSYQYEKRKDVEIFNRISDSQDNLDRVNYLIDNIEEAENSPEELERDKLELEQQLEALRAKAEVVVAEGLVIDRVKPEDMIVDTRIDDPDAYLQAERIAMRVWYTEDSYEAVFGKKPAAKVTRYNPTTKATQQGSGGDPKLEVAVWEIWDRGINTVFTIAQGDDDYSKPPLVPKINGERFYPFFLLVFNPVDGEFYPISDVELLKEVQDEYNRTRTQLSDHREQSIPHWLADAETDMETLKRYSDKVLGEVVLVDAQGKPIRDVIDVGKVPPMNPALYDVAPILGDFELLAGAGDANMGSVRQTKTLGEAEILNESLASRTDERQDVLEDMITEIAVYASEILLQRLTKAQVQRVAGEQAVWPELSKEQVFDLVQIETRAGTSGKPNKRREQEQWIQFMPLLKETIMAVSELRDSGREEEADTMVAVLKETFRRFDERLDVEEFIPEHDEGTPEEQLARARQMVMQLQQTVEERELQMQELQERAAQEVQKARERGEADIGRKMFQLEQMKLAQYDEFNKMVADLQQQFQNGITEVMKIFAEAREVSHETTPPQLPAPAPTILNLTIDAKSGEVSKTIEITGRDGDNNVKSMRVDPIEPPPAKH